MEDDSLMVHRQHRGSCDQPRPRALLRETHRRDHDRDQSQPRPVSVASQRGSASDRGRCEMTPNVLDGDVMRIALIVGSTRPNRFADHPVKWIQEGAATRSDFDLEILDLRDWPLPFFAEPTPPVFTGGVFT